MRNDWELLTETTDDMKVLKVKKNAWNTNLTEKYRKIQMEGI